MNTTDSPTPSGESETLEDRLKRRAKGQYGAYGLAERSIEWEAANELSRLRAENARLKEHERANAQLVEQVVALTHANAELADQITEATARAARLEEENALYREYYEASEAFADRKMTTIEQMEVMKRFRAAESALRATLNPEGGEHA